MRGMEKEVYETGELGADRNMKGAFVLIKGESEENEEKPVGEY